MDRRADSTSLRRRIAAIVDESGYRADEPVTVGVRLPRTGQIVVSRGGTIAGKPLDKNTITYTASLSKQVTAACLALLVQRGALDVESALAEWIPGLPGWAGSVRLRHLLHHTGGLPDDVTVDDAHTLRARPRRLPTGPPHCRSVTAVSGARPPICCAGAEPFNEDQLHLSELLQAPGRLDDGTPLGYAWGMGVRSHAGHRLYRHGGSWADLRALLIRGPAAGLSVVIVAPADGTERRLPLADGLLDLVFGE